MLPLPGPQDGASATTGQDHTSDPVQAIAWKAQKRLCGRYQHLIRAGKIKVQVCTAIARELTGFLWAVACAVQAEAR